MCNPNIDMLEQNEVYGKQLITEELTRITEDTRTLSDVILINDKEKIINKGVLDTYPQFIALVVGKYILSLTAPVTKVLQAKDCNLGEAYADVNTAKECIRAARKDEVWETVWTRIESIADIIGVEVYSSSSFS
eukprot:gene1001-10780_t